MARIVAPFVDRNNRSVIALQRIRRYGLSFERDQADHLERRLGFAAIVGGRRRQRQRQAQKGKDLKEQARDDAFAGRANREGLDRILPTKPNRD